MKRLTQWTPNGASLILDDPQTELEAKAQFLASYKMAIKKLAEYEDVEERGALGHNPPESETTAWIREIADTYGYEPQSRQLIEEMAELIQSINKLWRKRRNGHGSEVADARDDLVEEMADVQIMINQIKYLLHAEEDIEPIMRQKLFRQIVRIKERENEGSTN